MQKKIIVMEDDIFLREFYSFVFKKMNIVADILEDGELFFQKLENEKYDLIVMDLSLRNTYVKDEKVDGVTLSRMVKQNNNLKHIPIIVVTAHLVNYHSKHLFVDSMAEDYVIKPIGDVNVFIKKIENTIELFKQKL